ncbi:hypothetical protein QAD02_012246 [Eretmocerus hayati]|uniref:Uncharacterized protein n=1 Tax=Eretmocerus hayati TaxID=131215 RepID=A0ACC2P1R2_9HYME|nr:hypothetical protein QAD02_012246 [Eretmocerus hayati]
MTHIGIYHKTDVDHLDDESGSTALNKHDRNVKRNSWVVEPLPQTYFDTPIFATRVKRAVAKDTREDSTKIPELPSGHLEKNSQQQLPAEISYGCFYATPKPTTANPAPLVTSEHLHVPGNCMQIQIGPDGIPYSYTVQPPGQPQLFHPQPTPFQQRNVGVARWPTLDSSQITPGLPIESSVPLGALCFWVDPNSGQVSPMQCPNLPRPPTFQFPVITGFEKSAVSDRNNEKDRKDDDIVGATQIANPYAEMFGGLMRECPVNFYRCGDGSRCISRLQWCDNLIDCPDASDETKCSCHDRIGKARLCDNYIDCPHGEDELGCFGCPKNSFSCSEPWDPENNKFDNNAGCVSLEQRCDGIRQCASTGRDERDCSILSRSFNPESGEMYPVSFGSGFLQRNLRGRWYPVCGHAYSWAKDACAAELGQIDEEPTITMLPTTDHLVFGPYLEENGLESRLVSHCPRQVAYVFCPRPTFGERHGGKQASSPKPYALVGASSPRQGNSSGDPIVSIVGGQPSSPRAWPFILAITKDGVFHCGGVVLNEIWLLTAAHCFTGMQNHYYEVSAGLLRRSSFSPSQQTRHLTKIAIHPNFDPVILQNDVALGLLNQPLIFNSWVRPAKLPKFDGGRLGWAYTAEPRPGTTCTAVGWGTTYEGGSNPDELREVEIPVIGCKYREDRNSGEICAGYIQGGKDACQGDSGGPLMCRVSTSKNEWYVGGIVSHGIGCGRRNEPGAYTKVAHFVDWINSVMNSRSSTGGSVALIRPRTQCPGFSCAYPRTRCLQAKRRCDRVADCLSAEDEAGCPASLASHSEPRDSTGDSDFQEQGQELKSLPDGSTQQTFTGDAVDQTEANTV